jgi:hypothetical protein
MVALATPRFGFVPKINLARPMLREALECYDRGDLIGAGVRLRAAVYRQLTAMCEWYNCMPKKPKLLGMVAALRKAKQLDELGVTWLNEMIHLGNTAAHMGHLDRAAVRGAISGMFFILDCDPCNSPEERVDHPQPENCWDNDDFEDGDDWKIGGAI